MRLILGRAGAGKTEACLQAVRKAPQEAWLVLTSAQAVENLSARLQKAHASLPETAQVMDWYGMLERFLSGGRMLLSSSRRVALCARICEQTLRDEHYFGGVRWMPRFHQKLAQRFEEWGLQGLTPERLEYAAEKLPDVPELAELTGMHIPDLRDEWTRKTHEILQLWRAYLAQLQSKKWLDAVSLHTEAIQNISTLKPAPCQAIYLDGFRTLTELGIQVLDALEQRGVEIHLTLHDDPQRPELFAPANDLIQKLSSRFRVETVRLSEPHRFQSHALQTLEKALFLPSLPSFPSLPVSPSQPSVFVLDVPTKLVEVETVARQILMLNRDGVPYDRMAVLLRSPESYAALLQVIFERYDIPLSMELDLPLTHSPLIRDLLTALELLIEPLDSERLMEWLFSPFTTFPKEHRQALKRKTKRLRDDDELREWIAQLSTEGEYEPEASFMEAWQALRSRVQSTEGEEMSVNDLFEAISGMFLSPTAMKTRDSRAWQTAWQLANAFAEFAAESPLTVQLRAIAKHWRQAVYRYPVGAYGVRVMSSEEPDYGEPEAVFVMGVLEGTFPRRHPEDPFLRETERTCLTQYLQQSRDDEPVNIDLTTLHETTEAERLRFYRCVTAARRYLYLSYPRTDSESEAIPSLYLDDVRTALEAGGAPLELKFYRLDEIVPRDEECLHPYDLAKRKPLADAPDAGIPSVSADPFASLSSNRLNDPRTRAWAAQMNRAFSVTELEILAKCPFQHLARYRMKLRVSRPGLHSTEIGTLLHDTLRRTYAKAKPLPADQGELAAKLLENLNRVIAEKETVHPSWQLQVIREYCTRLLSELARREALYLTQFDVQPRYFEWSFGEGPPDEEEQGDRPRDPNSRSAPIQVQAGNGKTLQVCGVVDRIDVSPNPSTAMVIDYKLGDAVDFKLIEDGESFQMPLYGMAVQEHFGIKNVVFAYDTLSGERRFRIIPYDSQLIQQFRHSSWEGSQSDVVKIMGQSVWKEIQRKIAYQMESLVRTLEQAEVNPHPGSHCKQCAFGDFCRMADKT